MFRSTLLTVLQNGKNDDEAHNSWTKKRSKTSYLSFFFSFGATVSHISLFYIWAKLVFSKKKKKVWLWKHAESLQNAWTWVHLHVVSGPRTVQIPLFKAKLAEQVKKFAHPTTGSQQQPQVRCSLKLGRKKRLSVPLLCYSVLRRFWPDGLSNHIHPNHDMIRDTIPL